ncbi:MAG: HD domain-containing protein [Candidatus Aminicenantes bacterium]|nr:HD domain-containing protein [Candidatus Aminicenantes bacterium]
MDIIKLIPEIDLIKDENLRSKVIKAWEKAILLGGWEEDELPLIPFTLLIKNVPINLFQHTRAVTRCALGVYEAYERIYGKINPLNRDILLAGAILHDVGKLLEYEKSRGEFVKSKRGKLLRHPISGAALAWSLGLPEEVCHIIAAHSKEGDHVKRSPEAFVVYHCDFANFEPFREG